MTAVSRETNVKQVVVSLLSEGRGITFCGRDQLYFFGSRTWRSSLTPKQIEDGFYGLYETWLQLHRLSRDFPPWLTIKNNCVKK